MMFLFFGIFYGLFGFFCRFFNFFFRQLFRNFKQLSQPVTDMDFVGFAFVFFILFVAHAYVLIE